MVGVDFLLELQKLKTVNRKLLVGKRSESTAEHTWGVAMLTILFHDSNKHINLDRAIKIALVHDIVEILAGDVNFFDEESREGKNQREARAAIEIFKDHPQLHELWEEYDRKETQEAKYIHALDKLEPVFQNISQEGRGWKALGVTKEMILDKKTPYMTPPLLPVLHELIALAEQKGLL